MKKMVAAVATGIVITGTAVTSVSAADYQVKAGDTLWNIAQTHNTSVDSIINNNGLKGTIIYPNQTLSIGGGSSNTQVAQNNNGSYTVKSGDTLFKIAKANGVSVGTLKQWNNISSDLIVVGQKLSLSGQVQQTAQAQPQQAPVQQSARQQQQAPAQKAPAQQAQPQAKQTANPQGRQITVQSTAYTAGCAGCSGRRSRFRAAFRGRRRFAGRGLVYFSPLPSGGEGRKTEHRFLQPR